MRTREEIRLSERDRYKRINSGYEGSNNIKIDLILEVLLDIRDLLQIPPSKE